MMPAGRPSLYTPELLEAAEWYVNGGYESQGDPVPMLCGLAINLNVCRDTVQVWAKDEDKPEFSYIAKRLMAIQERELLKGGLRNEFNSSITKLALAKHDYSDKSETTQVGPVQVIIVGKDGSV
mgnify:CR=1 FL=1|jgi:hypothetical protein